MKTYRVSEIEWDTNGEDLALPTSIVIGAENRKDLKERLAKKFRYRIIKCSIKEDK